jgi:hypothetical protein
MYGDVVFMLMDEMDELLRDRAGVLLSVCDSQGRTGTRRIWRPTRLGMYMYWISGVVGVEGEEAVLREKDDILMMVGW